MHHDAVFANQEGVVVGVREVVGGDEVGLQGFGVEGQGFAVAGEEAVAGGRSGPDWRGLLRRRRREPLDPWIVARQGGSIHATQRDRAIGRHQRHRGAAHVGEEVGEPRAVEGGERFVDAGAGDVAADHGAGGVVLARELAAVIEEARARAAERELIEAPGGIVAEGGPAGGVGPGEAAVGVIGVGVGPAGGGGAVEIMADRFGASALRRSVSHP